VPRRYQVVLASIFVLLVVALAAVALVRHDLLGGSSSSNGIRGSGVGVSQSRDLGSFSSVELSGSNNVTIHVSERQAVVVRGDDNLVDRITSRVRGGALVIANTPGSFTTESPMGVDVGVPSLRAVRLTGSGNVSVSGIKAESLTVTLAGSGLVSASGIARRLDVTLGGFGNAWLEQLVASDVRAVVSGSGSIFVTATKSLDAAVPGTGAIVYGGNPKEVSKSVTGTGAITGS